MEEVWLKNEGKSLVKFGAAWCGPCRQMAPAVEALAEEGYQVYDIDTDANTELASKYGIRSLPTSVVFENGEVVDTKIVALTKQQILDILGE